MGKPCSPSILVVGASWPPQTFLARLFRGLLEAGCSVTIAGSQKPADLWQQYEKLHWLSTPEWKGSLPVKYLRLAKLFVKAKGNGRVAHNLARREISWQKKQKSKWQNWHKYLPFANGQWDIIYFPWNTTAVHHLPLYDLQIPVVLSCRGSQVNIAPHNPKRAFLQDGLRQTFVRATAVHCVSEDIKNKAEAYGLTAEKTVVIRPAVDPEFFRPARAKIKSDNFRILSIGALIWTKGYEDALTAVRLLIDKGISVQYEIIGSGPEKQRILYTIDDLNLKNSVSLSGKLTPEQIKDKLQQADAFLLTSHSEGISNAVLEAMACSLPVVTTDCGGMPEAVTDGVEGFVVPRGTPKETAGRLAYLAANAEARLLMGEAGRKKIKQEFNLDDQIRQFIELFSSISDRVKKTTKII